MHIQKSKINKKMTLIKNGKEMKCLEAKIMDRSTLAREKNKKTLWKKTNNQAHWERNNSHCANNFARKKTTIVMNQQKPNLNGREGKT